MLVSRSLKETVNDIPKCIGNLIEFTKIEKWKVSKASLLEQKKIVKDDITVKQIQLDEINQLLAMFEPEIKIGV